MVIRVASSASTSGNRTAASCGEEGAIMPRCKKLFYDPSAVASIMPRRSSGSVDPGSASNRFNGSPAISRGVRPGGVTEPCPSPRTTSFFPELRNGPRREFGRRGRRVGELIVQPERLPFESAHLVKGQDLDPF